MELISPICDEKISPHIGKPVCVVMKDETQFYGYLGGIREGRLLLTPSPQTQIAMAKSHRSKTKSVGKQGRAATSGFGAWPGYGYGNDGAFAIDLALIGLLFLLPFFFI